VVCRREGRSPDRRHTTRRRRDRPGTHPSATSLGPHATHRPDNGGGSAIDRAILILWPEVNGVRLADATASRPAEMIVSRKYAKPVTLVVAPSIPLAAISDVLEEFGVAP